MGFRYLSSTALGLLWLWTWDLRQTTQGQRSLSPIMFADWAHHLHVQQPVWCRPVFLLAGSVLSQSWQQLASTAMVAWQGSQALGSAVFGPPMAFLVDTFVFLLACCLPIVQVFH